MKKFEQPKEIRHAMAILSGPSMPSGSGAVRSYELLYGLGGAGGGLIARYLSNQAYREPELMLEEIRREAFAFLDAQPAAKSVEIPLDREGQEFETVTRSSIRPIRWVNPDLSHGASTKPGSAMAVHGGDAAAGTAFGPAPHVTAAEFSAVHAPKADPFDIGDKS